MLAHCLGLQWWSCISISWRSSYDGQVRTIRIPWPTHLHKPLNPHVFVSYHYTMRDWKRNYDGIIPALNMSKLTPCKAMHERNTNTILWSVILTLLSTHNSSSVILTFLSTHNSYAHTREHRLLGEALWCNWHITDLDLSDSEIDPRAAKALAKVISRENSVLRMWF